EATKNPAASGAEPDTDTTFERVATKAANGAPAAATIATGAEANAVLPANPTTASPAPATDVGSASATPKNDVGPAVPASPPALSADPAAVTTCVSRVLPEGTLRLGKDVNVGYLCTQSDLWGIGRKFNMALAQHGQGPGMVLWAHLGRFDLAAIAL